MSSILGARPATVKFVIVQMPPVDPRLQILGCKILSGCLGYEQQNGGLEGGVGFAF